MTRESSYMANVWQESRTGKDLLSKGAHELFAGLVVQSADGGACDSERSADRRNRPSSSQDRRFADADTFEIIESIRQEVASFLSRPSSGGQESDSGTKPHNSTISRTWFYFPSISTRSKRDDLVHSAPSYGLTGFLYAGKPGLLCLEGGSQNIDEYMRFIKTESWGDIPAHHKKVSERLRETEVERVFGDMSEITDSVGERRGQRVNRGDMRAVEEWLR